MTFVQVMVFGLIALIIISPWFLFVHSTIGSWMPSSGQMESERITFDQLYRFRYMADSLLSSIAPWVYRFFSELSIGTIFGCASCAFLAYLLYRSPETRTRLMGRGGYLFLTAPWLTAILVLVLTYTLSFRVVSFYTRYSSPLVIVTCRWQPWFSQSRKPFPVDQLLSFSYWLECLLVMTCHRCTPGT